MVGAFALVEQCLGAGHPMNARQTYRAPQQVSAESFEPLGILRPYGGRCVNGEAATAKRTEQLNAFVTQESLALQQVQYFVSEQLLGSDGIDVGDRPPLTLLIPKPTRGKSMQVRMWLDETSKGLRYGHDTGAGFVVAGGLEHQLLDGFVCESSELPQKLPVAHEIRS